MQVALYKYICVAVGGEWKGNNMQEVDAEQVKRLFPETATLRDQFAMAALTGLLTGGFNYKAAAGVAYDVADAMMEARK
jgi:hypothetical protein